MARLPLVYPRIPDNGVYLKGAKSIEGATGDIARTTTGFIEDAKYGFPMTTQATAVSGEFDTAVTRTGLKTLKLSTTDATGQVYIVVNSSEAGGGWKIVFQANTEYTFSCWVKTTNVVSAYLRLYDPSTARSTNALAGTNDWTLCTVTWTTGAAPSFDSLEFHLNNAGNISDSWWDVNSMTLVKT